MKYVIIIILIVIGSIIIAGIIATKANKNKSNAKNTDPNKPVYKPKQKTYIIKEKYVSNCEQEFFETIKQIINDSPYSNYIVYPQVPLSQIVNKYPETIWITELFRVIDFCIFSSDYKPLVCIEINDKTHHEYERYKRDQKVKDILAEAGLPLITLWTEYGVNKDYIAKRISEHIRI